MPPPLGFRSVRCSRGEAVAASIKIGFVDSLITSDFFITSIQIKFVHYSITSDFLIEIVKGGGWCKRKKGGGWWLTRWFG